MEALRKRSAKRMREGPGSVRDTIEKWRKLTKVTEQRDISSGEQQVRKMAAKGSRNGCMKGKGGPENSTSKFRGCRQRVCGKWVAEIREPNGGKRLWLGTFNSDIEAASAYDEAARSMYGNRARLNFPSSTSGSQTSAMESNGVSDVLNEGLSSQNEVPDGFLDDINLEFPDEPASINGEFAPINGESALINIDARTTVADSNASKNMIGSSTPQDELFGEINMNFDFDFDYVSDESSSNDFDYFSDEPASINGESARINDARTTASDSNAIEDMIGEINMDFDFDFDYVPDESSSNDFDYFSDEPASINGESAPINDARTTASDSNATEDMIGEINMDFDFDFDYVPDESSSNDFDYFSDEPASINGESAPINDARTTASDSNATEDMIGEINMDFDFDFDYVPDESSSNDFDYFSDEPASINGESASINDARTTASYSNATEDMIGSRSNPIEVQDEFFGDVNLDFYFDYHPVEHSSNGASLEEKFEVEQNEELIKHSNVQLEEIDSTLVTAEEILRLYDADLWTSFCPP